MQKGQLKLLKKSDMQKKLFFFKGVITVWKTRIKFQILKEISLFKLILPAFDFFIFLIF